MNAQSAAKVGTMGGAHPLDKIFCPRSIAVLGVTKTPGTVPYDCFYNILYSGYQGTLYPIAPGKKSICAVPAYRYVTDVPEEIDLGIIILPANVCDRALEMCGQKGIKSVIMISAGFRELGTEEGAKREARIRDIIKEYGINMIGPNCFGTINADPAVGMNASFSKKMPYYGRIGFLSQSGGMCAAALDYAMEHQIGFTKFVSFGNKAGVSEVDLLNYLHQDEQTHVIMMYLEELGVNARRLIEAAGKITRGSNPKPIVAIKSGRTARGAVAASSHTGSRASDDAIVDSVFREAGIIRCGTFQELFDHAMMLAYQPLPKGNRLAIVTNTGGPGVLCTDAAVISGKLEIAKFDPSTTAALKDSVPATASVKNPVDVLGDGRSERYGKCLELSLSDPNVDQAIVILTPHSMTDVDDIAQACTNVQRKVGKPVAVSFMGGLDVASGVKRLLANHTPHFLMPEYAAQAMANIQRILEWRAQKPHADKPVAADKPSAEAAVKGKSGQLASADTQTLLKSYGVAMNGAANGNHEVLLMGRQDATFGPVLGFAASKELAEAFSDVAYSVAPFGQQCAERMVSGVKGSRLLEGKVDLEAVQKALVAIGQLLADLPQVAEVEIKGASASKGWTVTDARIVVK